MIEFLRRALGLGLDFARRPLETWRNCEALAEFQDALEAEYASFCATRELDPEAEGSEEAWWDTLDAMVADFAEARGSSADASETLEAFEVASDEFERWCEGSGRQVFEAGLFQEWLAGSASGALGQGSDRLS